VNLATLNPHWVAVSNASPNSPLESARIGVSFDCPCCRKTRLMILFRNTIGPTLSAWPYLCLGDKFWDRQGETFDDLTLSPSIDCSKSGHWHGFITAGEVS
jgi:hypothetical protein